MRVLSLDTTTAAGSVALVVDDRVVMERNGEFSCSHAERLPSDIIALLDACGVAVAEVDLFAVACGPGSFTGLRIGIATIQGLAFVHGRGVVAISSLEALAHVASLETTASPVPTIASWMDAHRAEVFSALYRVAAAAPFEPERLVEIEAPAVGDPSAVIARWTDGMGVSPEIFIGDGAVKYHDAIHRSSGAVGHPRERATRATIIEPPALAGAIGRLGAGRARRGGATSAAGIRPLYVRRPDAEIARDRRP